MTAIATAAMILAACGNKTKGAATTADSTATDLLADGSPTAERRDTTPQPMFIMDVDEGHMLMLYWYELDEPKKNKENVAYFDDMYKPWAKQDAFRRNRAQYTNMVMYDKTLKIKYVD